jgi:hemerythrin-like domain-containing protein
MNAIDGSSPVVERLEQEHGAFRTIVREIEAELARRQQARDLEGCGETLLAQLDDFSGRLKRHFTYEESGWSRVEVAMKCSPATRRWIDMLTRQHDDFRQRIDRLTAALETSLVSGVRLPGTFEGELSSLLADLTRHELSESRLFQRSVFEELGGFD